MLQGYRGGVKEEDLKLKKEKETERQKKLESASMLQGYRGGVAEDDLKLKALRDEERKRREDAERTLHSYQAKEVNTIPKERKSMGPQSAAYPTPVNAGGDKSHDYLAGIEFGNVSERAAALSAAAEHATVETNTKNGHANAETPQSAPVVSSSDSPMATQLKVASISDSPVLVEAPQMSDSPVMVSPPALEEEAEEAPAETMPTFLEATPPAATVNGSDALAEQNGHATRTSPSTLVADELSVRFDILFSFGLVTVHQDPNLSSYMAAVQNVVSSALLDKRDSNIVFNPSYGPFVRDKQWDTRYVSRSGRADVKRLVVTAAVPIFASSSSLRSQAKKSVIEALQAAIQSGDFLSLAQP